MESMNLSFSDPCYIVDHNQAVRMSGCYVFIPVYGLSSPYLPYYEESWARLSLDGSSYLASNPGW